MSKNRYEKNKGGSDSTALTAVALQDHLVRLLNLGSVQKFGPRNIGIGPASRAKQKRPIRSVVDTGRNKNNKPRVQEKDEEKEYVLEPQAAPKLSLVILMTENFTPKNEAAATMLDLHFDLFDPHFIGENLAAQKMGLVEAPDLPLTEQEWKTAKEKSNKREDSKQPCVICKDVYGVQEQVLLSCTHVFHKNCLQAFEKFTGRKSCPMCRKEAYQTRVIHEGAKEYRIMCATRIQAAWRGYVVKCWYRKLRESVPPKDPKLRQKFYEEKLTSITDRIVRSCDFNVNTFLTEIDQSLAMSRDIFRQFDETYHVINDDEWDVIQLKAVQRESQDCPICLTSLVCQTYIQPQEPETSCSHAHLNSTSVKSKYTSSKKTRHSNKEKTTATSGGLAKSSKSEETQGAEGVTDSTRPRRTVLLSCSHVFHEQCLKTFEELALGDGRHTCPVCRTIYQKKILHI